MTEAPTAQEIAITRVLDAPRELVWDAWTEPGQLSQWWGKRGWSARPETITMDVRPGGAFRLTSVNDEDGSEMPQEGVYREVSRPERLVIEEAAEGAWHEGAVTVVTLVDLGDGRTEMTMHATVHTTDEMGRVAEGGMESSLERLGEHLAGRASAVDFRLEVVVVPVSDVDRAKDFYTEKLGFNPDHDTWVGEERRVVQLTPRGSACSIVIGEGLTQMEPGSRDGLQLVVSDMDAAYAELTRRGLELGEVQELGAPGRPGFKFVFFSDPDGNGWAVQEIRADQV
jgi:uncharacterized protein YndB with AHSA1/START domain/catechol 2,3-dioxygenase-like lactoylglutathione lyase family enzyme